MHETLFRDLWLRVGPGAWGLYCHQGNCEHVISVSDMRTWHPQGDPPLRRQYPILIHRSKVVQKKCAVCLVSSPLRLGPQSGAMPHEAAPSLRVAGQAGCPCDV